MLQDLRRVLGLYYSRLQAYVATAPPGSLQLTGVLGLAALLVAYYQLRRPRGAGGSAAAAAAAERARSREAGGAGSSGAAAAAGGGRLGGGKDAGGSSKQQEAAAATPLGRAVRSKLAGVGRVTVSALGALTEEASCTELQEGVSLRPAALEVLREVAACTDTYIITQVQDDIGQAVMLGALEAAGVLGRGQGQVAPHHVLFCSTADGKVSLVRQLEPDLHVDNSARTISDLQRFMPRLLHLPAPGSGSGGGGSGSCSSAAAVAGGSSNVLVSSSLAAYFGP